MKIVTTFLLVFVPVILAQTSSTPRPQSVSDWRALIPELQKALETTFPKEEITPVGILRPGHIGDVTGDGVSEAAVFFGTGGASTSQLTLVRIENGQPIIAPFKSRNGKVSPMVFIEGASVTHTDGVELLPEQHAVYSFRYTYSGPKNTLDKCEGEVYVWNPSSKTFNFNSALSKNHTKKTCAQVPKRAGP